MQIQSLLEAIQSLWEFAWPPVVMVACVLGTIFFVDPARRTLPGRIFDRMEADSMRVEATRALLERYGLAKVLPIASSIALVSTLFLLNKVVVTPISNLPPYFFTRPMALLAPTMAEPEKVLLLRKYPTSRNLEEAFSLARESLLEERKISRGSVPYHRVFGLLKASLIAGFACFLVALRRRTKALVATRRFGVLLLGTASIWSVLFVGYIWEEEQHFRSEWRAIRLSIQADALLLSTNPPSADESKVVNLPQPVRWWRVSFTPPAFNIRTISSVVGLDRERGEK